MTCAPPLFETRFWQHYNTWIAERAAAFIERTVQECSHPFMLFVSWPDPHHPFAPPRPWADMFDPEDMPAPRQVEGELERMPSYVRARLGVDWISNNAPVIEQGGLTTTEHISPSSMAKAIALTRASEAMIDDAIGAVLAAVERAGITERTHVLFTSDHGEMGGHHGLLHKGPPPYRDVTQVSFIMAGPGVPHGVACTAPTSHIDIVPTVLDLCGVNPQPFGLDGESLCPLLRPDSAGSTARALRRDARFLEYHARQDERTYNHSIVTGGWRLTLYPNGDAGWGELFDLAADPAEHHNLYASTRADVVAVRESLRKHLLRDFPPAPDAGTLRIAKW